MQLPFEIIVLSELETAQLAQDYAALLKAGDVVCLNGNLGSGKTFFVKSICKELGIGTTSSPSFAIVNEYSGKVKVIHVDFYRLKKLEELFDIGFDEYLRNQEAVVFIEWANLFEDILPKKYYSVEITQIDETSRKISIKKHE